MTKEEAKKKLTNTKVYVNGKSKEIQEKLFEIGFKWSGGSGQNVSYANAPFLFIKEDIFYSLNMQTFKEESEKEVSADDILNFKIDEEFIPKHGDIIFATDKYGFRWVSIFNKIENNDIYTYVDLTLKDKAIFNSSSYIFSCIESIHDFRLATEEEKSMLFSALKEKGLVWNEKTKEVEKIKKEHEFKPFDKVLVRDFIDANWDIDFFQEIVGEDIDYKYICLSNGWNFCIPYEGNEHLLGTLNSPK